MGIGGGGVSGYQPLNLLNEGKGLEDPDDSKTLRIVNFVIILRYRK